MKHRSKPTKGKPNSNSAKVIDLALFREKSAEEFLTTNQGLRINDDQNSLKAGERGPSLLEDFLLREKITHFDHERIPERIVHARGEAAHGVFQVYESMASITKARFLQDPTVKTPVFVRFSTVVGSRGSSDLARDVRGFAVKFYTEEGNYDLVGNNIPVFFIQDAVKFPDLVHSCTAGRSAFITGQSGFRTGNLKVGLPGAKEGLQARDVTLAQLLKAQGYMTAQFGKNHLGDLDEHLPTAHGFDEFFGSLYHLNAEQEPENEDYFKDPALRKKYGTRGVIHTWANPDGTQKIESTGPLNMKRMETIDEEVTKLTLDYLTKAKQADKPFFLWWNSTRMHIWTHLKKESKGKTGLGVYPDGMVEHDGHIGQILDKLKELGMEDNTIVMYSTDNGAEKMSWPDGGTSPFRGEKNENWEGGYRVPCAIRWPGVIKPGTVLNDIFSHEDMIPTLMAAAGDATVKEKLLKGMKVGDKTFKVHLDGYNITDALAGKSPSPRKEFFYWSDDGSLVALRYDNWKLVFAEQRAHGFDVWQEPFVTLRLPKLFNLRSDPFEEGDHVGMDYKHWRIDRVFLLVPAQEYIAKFIATFKDYPPSQKVGSFSLDQVLEKLSSAQTVSK